MEASDIAASGATGLPRSRGLEAASPRYGEKAIKAFLAGCALLSVLTTTAIVISLLGPALGFFGEVSPTDFFFKSEWAPAQDLFGVLPLVVGTLNVVLWGMLFAVPIGLGSAIYLAEYAPPRVRKTVKPVLETLAGVPTIVFGYFALTFFTPEILRGVLNVQVNQFNALAAGIIMGFLVLPTIASVAEDAMSAVPAALREGAFGMGATKLQVSTRIVFPAALSGIVAALILGASRAVGETVIVLIAGGQTANLSVNPEESYQSMAAFIAATSRGDIPTGSIEFETIFVVGMTLFVLTLILNVVSIRLVNRYRQVYE